LAWSEYWRSKWSAKKVSPAFSPSGLAHFDNAELTFKGVVDGDLVVTCYSLTPFPDQWSTPIGEPRFALHISGCLDSIVLDETGGGAFWMLLPTGTTIEMMSLVETTPETSNQLRVIEGEFPVTMPGLPQAENFLYHKKEVTVLRTTPGTFRVTYPHQYPQFTYPNPFFFQDRQRTYVATSEAVPMIAQMISNPNLIGPIERSIDLQDFKYPNLPDPGDPPIFQTDITLAKLFTG